MTDNAVKLESEGTIQAAVQDAMARSQVVFSAKSPTLVDLIPQEEWDEWDASNERPNVVDSTIDSTDDETDVGFSESSAA